MEKISKNAFNRSTKTALTNEIPHLSAFNILNRQLKNAWSRDLIGEFHIKYGDYSSEKIMNGVVSDLYQPVVEDIVDVEKNQILKVTFGKPSFSIDGAFETEMDYLMHEKARYLSKLYPDDFNALITLTEAERQSYFNEALHMIHSYFDTEQIRDENETNNFYLREKFCEEITPIRALTGTMAQEKLLCKLVDFSDTEIYTGLSVYKSERGASLYSRNNNDLEDTFSFNIFKYRFVSDTTILQEYFQVVAGKIQTSLSNFFENSISYLEIRSFDFDKISYSFSKLKNTNLSKIVTACIDGDPEVTGIKINKDIEGLARGGSLDANFYSVLEAYSNRLASFPEDTTKTQSSYLGLSYSRSNEDLRVVPFSNGKVDVDDSENCLFVHNSFTYKDFDQIKLIQTGRSVFTKDYLESVGNLIFSVISSSVQNDETYKRYINGNFFTQFEVFQDDGNVMKAFKLAADLNDFQKYYESGKTYFGYKNYEKEISVDNVFDLYSRPSDTLPAVDFTKDFVVTTTFWGFPVSLFKEESNLATVLFVKSQDDSFPSFFVSTTNIDGMVIVDESGGFVDVPRKNTKFENNSVYTFNNKEFHIPDMELDTTTNEVKLNGEVISRSFFTNGYFNFDILEEVNETLHKKTALPFALKTFTVTLKKEDNHPNDVSTRILSRNLEVKKIINLKDLLLQNTNVKRTTLVSADNTYIYCNQYLKKEMLIETTETLNNNTLVENFFKKTKPEGFYLQKLDGKIFDESHIVIEDDIKPSLREKGFIEGVLIDSTGKKFPIKIIQAIQEFDKEYLKLEEELGTSVITQNLDKGCTLILDPLQRIELGETSSNSSKAKRLTSSRSAYKLNENYIFNVEWQPIKLENYNFLFENIEARNPEVYTTDQIMVDNTIDPQSLTFFCNCLLIDKNKTNIDTIQDLIAENKSLYLDTILQFFNHIPLLTGNLVFNNQYGSYGYLNSSVPPSNISFYKVNPNILGYQPLDDLLDFDATDKKDVAELQRFFNKREMVWGQVTWDGNIDKSVSTLRTVWAGYFSNFEIESSKDFLPEETLVKSYSAAANSFGLDILNYNYNYNEGSPGLEWNIATSLPNDGQSVILALGLPVFENKSYLENSAPVNVHLYAERSFYGFFFNSNRLRTGQYNFERGISTVDLNKLNSTNLTLEYEINNDLEVSYDRDTGIYKGKLLCDLENQGTFNKGASYKFWAFYNQIFIEDIDYVALGLLESNINNTSFNLFVEMCLYMYVNSEVLGYREEKYTTSGFGSFNLAEKLGIEKNSGFNKYLIPSIYESDLPGENPSKEDEVFIQQGLATKSSRWGAYRKALIAKGKNADEKEIFFEDVLEYISKQNYKIPCITRLSSDEKILIDYFRVIKLGENHFKISQGTFESGKNPDLLYSVLLENNQNFQPRKAEAVDVFARLSSNQINLPLGKDGIFNDFGIAPNDMIDVVNQETLNKIISYDYEKENIILNNISFSPFIESFTYREFYTDTLDLYLEDPIMKEAADIERCVVHFEKDHHLTNNGYLYLYDLKIPNRRSSFSKKRETQLVDRSFNVDKLHLLSFQESEDSIKLLVADSILQNGNRISNAIESLTPLDESLHTQGIKSDKLVIGFNWVDPDTDIGYTYYKRKFITEVTLDGGNSARLVISGADDSFVLEDHISLGDLVEIQLIDAPSGYSEGKDLVFENKTGTFKGPYKVVAEETRLYPSTTNDTDDAVYSNIVLGGRGNICLLKVNVYTGTCSISTPVIFDPTGNGSAFESAGYLYYFDPTTDSVKTLGNLNDFIETSGSVSESSVNTTVNPHYNEVTSTIKNTLVDHSVSWGSLTDANIQITNALPLKGGKLIIDSWDRMAFEDSGSSVSWKNDIGELDRFEDPHFYQDEIKIGDSFIKLEDATRAELISFIRLALCPIFGIDTSLSQLNAALTSSGEAPATGTEKAHTYTITDNEESYPAVNRLANILFAANQGDTIDLSSSNIYLPSLETRDVPYFFGKDNEVKWVKTQVIVGRTSTLINEESVPKSSLRKFARLLLPYYFSCRKAARISSCEKDANNIILWDQSSSALTVLDGGLNPKKNIKLPYLGIRQQHSNSNLINDLPISTYEFSKFLYLVDNYQGLNEYITWANSYLQTSDNRGAYTIWNQGQPLYLPTVFARYLTMTDTQLETTFASFGKKEEAIEMMKELKIAGNYDSWLSKVKQGDYLTSSFGNLLALGSSDGVINAPLIYQVLSFLGKTTEASLLNDLLTMNGVLSVDLKGIPHITDVCMGATSGLVAFGVNAIKENNAYFAYESLVETSGVTLVGNNVLVYGVINWPTLGEGANEYLGKLKASILPRLNDPEISEENRELTVNAELQIAKSILNENYIALNIGDTYTSGRRNFILSINTETCEVTPIKLIDSLHTEENLILSIMKSSNNGVIALTKGGWFEIDPNSDIITEPVSSSTLLSEGTVLSIDACKSLSFFSDISVRNNGSITMKSKGNSVDMPEVYNSRIRDFNGNEIYLQDYLPGITEDLRAVIAVRDSTKDNFQLGYCNCDPQSLNLTESLFEVSTPFYADFASYNNISRVPAEDGFVSVFDIYPTWEVIDSDKRKDFYSVDENNQLKYVTNKYGRELLRLEPIFEPSDGVIILRKEEDITIAGESVKESVIRADPLRYVSKRKLVGKSYEDILTKYQVQKIPELVKDPLNAILDFDYKSVEFKIDKENSNVKVADNYLLLTLKKDGNWDFPETLYKGDSSDFADANKIQTQNICAAMEDLPEFTLEELKEGAPNFFYSDKLQLLESSKIEYFVQFVDSTASESISTKAIYSAKVYNDESSVIINKEIAVSNALAGLWKIIKKNGCISSVTFKINNRTDSLPKFVPITQYLSSNKKGNDFQITTDCYEMYIPPRGYGQALIGKYTLPKECLFPNEEKIFFDEGYKTVNSNGEQFILVNEIGDKILDTSGNDVLIPKMVYRSFYEADASLDKYLPTSKDVEGTAKSALIDLSMFDVGQHTISLEKKLLLGYLNLVDTFSDNENKEDLTYTLFKENLKIYTKLLYSELPYDVSSSNVKRIDEDISLKNYIKETRKFQEFRVPSGYKYQKRDLTYTRLTAGYSQDKEKLSCDEEGNLLYLDYDGQISKTAIYNPPINAERTRSPSACFTVNELGEVSSYLLAGDVLGRSKKIAKFDFNNKTISFGESIQSAPILFLKDPSLTENQQVNRIYNESINKDIIPIRFVFRDYNVKFTYKTKIQDYNFVYLKNKKGEVTGKIFFKNPISSNDILCFSQIG